MSKPSPRRGRPPRTQQPPAPADEPPELEEDENEDEEEPEPEPVEAARPRPVSLERLQQPKRGPLGDLPLFAGITLGGNPDESPAWIDITREAPVREGQLPRLKLDAGPDDIRRMYGGGTYLLEVRTANGRLVPQGKRQLDLSGDPILQSQAMRTEYARLLQNLKGEPAAPAAALAAAPAPLFQQAAPASAPAPPPDQGIYAMIGAILASQAQQQANMIAVITAQTSQREANQLELFKLLSQREQKSDPLDLFKEGLKLGGKVFGEEKPDAVSRAIDAAPALLDKVTNAIRAERKPAGGGLTPEQAVAAAYEAIARREDVLLLEGKIAQGALAAVKRLTELGVATPEAALEKLFDLIGTIGPAEAAAVGIIPPLPAAAAPPPAPGPEAPVAAPAPDVGANSAPALT